MMKSTATLINTRTSGCPFPNDTPEISGISEWMGSMVAVLEMAKAIEMSGWNEDMG